MLRKTWNAILFLDSTQQGELSERLLQDRRVNWVMTSSIRELYKKIEVLKPEILIIFNSNSLTVLQDLKKKLNWSMTMMVYCLSDDENNNHLLYDLGVSRVWNKQFNLKQITHEAICDAEIYQSCLQKVDLISRPKMFDEGSIGIICASTGGPRVVHEIIKKINLYKSSLVILQHMPENFILDFSIRLQNLTEYEIKIVETECIIEEQKIYLPAGGKHLLFFRIGKVLWARSVTLSLTESYTPSINLTLASAAAHLHDKAQALILTGMGEDGALGSQILSARNGRIFCQNPKNATVPSMPEATLELTKATIIENDFLLPIIFMEALSHEQKRTSA